MFASALFHVALISLAAAASGKDPDYARFAKGEWKPAFTDEQAIEGGSNAEFKAGVVTLNDGFVRDGSDGAVSAKDIIVRAKIRGRGALFVRGNTENYIAWFGEHAVGVNKYVDRNVHVLGMRNWILDPQDFHELALAAVGDRVLVFVDGRRVLDVVDNAAQNATAVALQSYQSKSDFKEIEVMSLDGLDVGKLLPDRDPLEKAVGTWDVERTLTIAGQPPRTSTGVMHVARLTLADFYLIRSTASDGSSSLFVQKFLPEESALRTWNFHSNGQMETYDKAIDPDTGTQTIPPHPQKNGVLSGEIRPLNANTSETRFKTVGPDGTTRFEFVSLNKHRTEAGDPPNLRADGPAEEIPELATLAPYVGHWNLEIQLRPTKFEPQAKVETMLDDTGWILSGRFLMRLERAPSGELMNLTLAGYDATAKTLAFIMFQAGGNVVKWNTTWEPAAKSFNITLIELPHGWTGSARDRVVDSDTLESVGLLKDGSDATIWGATITRRRKK